MAITSVLTTTSTSPHCWTDASGLVIEQVNQTLHDITGLKVRDEKADVAEGAIVKFLVPLPLTFPLDEPGDQDDEQKYEERSPSVKGS